MSSTTKRSAGWLPLLVLVVAGVLVRVWWGGVLGTDATLDVEPGEFVYREMVHDGGLAFSQYAQARESESDADGER